MAAPAQGGQPRILRQTRHDHGERHKAYAPARNRLWIATLQHGSPELARSVAPLTGKNPGQRFGEDHHKLKSISMAAVTLAVSATCFVLLPVGQRVEPQSAGMFVNAVDLDVVPAKHEARQMTVIASNAK